MGLGNRFVGRTGEIEVLRRELGRARSGDVRLVLVSGEPGIGKSRLVSEFAEEASRGALVLLTHCLELSGQAVPLAPIHDLVHRAYRRLGPARLREAAGVYAADLALLEPALASDVPAPAQRPEGSTSRRQLDAVRHLLEQLGDSEPVLVVVEDLHWADPSTVDVLRHLATSMEGARVLVVATLRDGTPTHQRLRAAAAGMTSVTCVDLGRLGPQETATLADAVRTDHPDVDHGTAPASALGSDHVAHAVRASHGNPLYLQELLSASDVGELPPPLQTLLLARLSTLSEAARDIVDLVSVGDPPLRYSDLLRAADLPEQALDDALADAEARAVLTTDHGDHVSLRHPLLGDAARADMDIGRRRDRHRTWAATLSARALTPRTALRISYHWQQADELDDAVRTAMKGAGAAGAACDYVTQAALLDRVCALWPDAGAATRSLDLVDVLQDAARAHELAGDYSAAAAVLEHAIERSSDGDPSRTASLLATRGRVAFWQGDSMLPFMQRALDVLPLDGHTSVRAQVLSELCDALKEEGRYAAAEDAANEAVRLARESGNEGAAALALVVLANVTQHDDPQRAVEAASTAIELADRAGAGDVMLQAMATRLLTRGALLGVGPRSCLEEIEHDLSLAHARGLDHHRLGAWLRVIQAYTYLEMGDLDAALDAAERALPALRSHGAENHSRCIRATVHLIRGEPDAARAELACRVRSHYAHFDAAGLDPQSWLVWHDDGPEAAAELLLPLLTGLAARQPTALITVPEMLYSLSRYLRLSGRADDPDDTGVVLLDRARSFLRPIIAHDPLLDVIDATLAHADHVDPVPYWRSAAAKGPSWAAGVYWHVETLLRLAEATDRRAEALKALGTAHTEAQRLGSRAQLDEIAAVRRRLDRRGGPSGLTAREVEVLQLVADGLSNTEIGRQLHVSRSTVGVHISNVLAKTGAPDRDQAAAWGLQAGLLVSAGGPPASR